MRQLSLLDRPPPRVAASDTSAAAADSMAAQTPSLRALVLAELRRRGAGGATNDELEVALFLRHQTLSARVRELVQGGLVEDSGDRRFTRSGRRATVWRVRP